MKSILEMHLEARVAHMKAYEEARASLEVRYESVDTDSWTSGAQAYRNASNSLDEHYSLRWLRERHLVVFYALPFSDLRYRGKKEQRRHASECLTIAGTIGICVSTPVNTYSDRTVVLLPNEELVEPLCQRHRALICERVIDGILDQETVDDFTVLYETWCERVAEYRARETEKIAKRYGVKEKSE